MPTDSGVAVGQGLSGLAAGRAGFPVVSGANIVIPKRASFFAEMNNLAPYDQEFFFDL
jgi:hypothetical protein